MGQNIKYSSDAGAYLIRGIFTFANYVAQKSPKVPGTTITLNPLT